MPRLVKGPDGVTHAFPDDATDQEISAALDAAPTTGKGTPARTWADTASDVATGFAKGAARTAVNLGQLVHMLPGVTPTVDALYGQPGLSDAAFTDARQRTTSTNTPQMIGGGLEAIAELATPIAKGVNAIPRVARAGEKFQSVMAAARTLPVDVQEPGTVALRISELADRGGSMPMAVRKFIGRVTDPAKAPLNYEEARDFASNISRLSANEYQRLTPVIAREVASLRVSLNESIANTAKAAGKLDEYRSAMKEYAQAMKLRDAIGAVVEGAKKSAPFATAAGAGYWLTSKLRGMLE